MHHGRTNICRVAICLLAFAACDKVQTRLPNELIGSWTTDEPAYRNRAVKLEKDYVLIGFGEDVTPTVQRITKVETLNIDTGIACTIYSCRQRRSAPINRLFQSQGSHGHFSQECSWQMAQVVNF